MIHREEMHVVLHVILHVIHIATEAILAISDAHDTQLILIAGTVSSVYYLSTLRLFLSSRLCSTSKLNPHSAQPNW